MAISYVGQISGTNSATLPAHQAGDIIVGWAFNETTITVPTLAVGWTDINSGATSSCAARCGYIIATGSGTSSGTWTNATEVCFQIYRGARGIGGNTLAGQITSLTVTYKAIALTIDDGTSWVVGFAGHRNPDTSIETPPSGMVNKSGVVDALAEAVGHDTSGAVASWADTIVNLTGTAGHWRSQTVEILARRDIVMPAAQGSYGVTGLPAQVLGPIGKAGYPGPLPSIGLLLNSNNAYALSAAQGTYNVAGQLATLRKARLPLTSAQGTYSISGQDVALTVSARGQSGYPGPLPHIGLLLAPTKVIVAAQGAYTVTGQSAGLAKGYKITAAVGAYAIVGADSKSDFQMTSAGSAYALSGQSVSFFRGYKILAAQGFYNLAGQGAGLRTGHTALNALGAVYGIAGQVVGLRIGRRLVAANGVASVAGQAASLRRARVLVAGAGSYASTGNAANLVYSFQSAFSLTAQFGTYDLGGTAARVFADRRVYPAMGALALAGSDAGMASQRRVAAGGSTYAVTGSDASLQKTVRSLVADAGYYALTGVAVQFVAPVPALVAGTGAIFLTGGDAEMRVGTSIDPSESRTVYVTPESRIVYMAVQ